MPAEALLASEEATEIWQQLTGANPDTSGTQLERANATRHRTLSALQHNV